MKKLLFKSMKGMVKHVWFLLAVLVLTGAFQISRAEAANKIGYVNHSYLNLRSQATTSSNLVVVLAENDPLEITEELGGWYKVIATHAGKKYNGYVAAQYVTFDAPVVPGIEYNGYVKASSVYLRKAGNLTSAKVVKLTKNDKLLLDNYRDGWYAATALHNGKTYKGYVVESYVAFNPPTELESIGYVKSNTLNLREDAGTSYGVIVRLSKYDPLIIRSYKDGWYRVTATHEGAGYTGYVLGENIKIGTLNLSSAKPLGYANLKVLNLRRYPTTEAQIIVKLSKNDKLYFVDTSGNWYKVVALHNGKYYYGYVGKKYVRLAETNTPTPSFAQKTGYVMLDQLKVRLNPSTSGVIIASLSLNDKVILKDYKNGWYLATAIHNNVEYNGYVAGKHIKLASNGYVNYTYLNLRDRASTAGNIVTILSQNDKVEIIGEVGEWFIVTANHNGEKYYGYVLGSYITIL